MEDFSQNSVSRRGMLPVGVTLNGKYRIERPLASGGFGNTYVATNVFFEERVAVKEFYMRGVTERDGNTLTVSVSNEENLLSFTEQKAKFIKEARRLRKLQNQHIVRVHDLFEENGTAYYVMDFIEGESLSGLLKRTAQPIGEERALTIIEQILNALAVVHEKGIYHLDIKPANIMLDQSGRAVLIDFGASKQTKQEGGVTTSTGLSYTPGYAPIEQMAQNSRFFGPWTDIYSLGATLYYMLTLHTLPSPADLLEDESLLQLDGVSSRVQQLVRSMMAPIRTNRPQNVAEVLRLMNEEPAPVEEPVDTIPVHADAVTEMMDLHVDSDTEVLNQVNDNVTKRQMEPEPEPEPERAPIISTYEEERTEAGNHRLWITVAAFVGGLCLVGAIVGGIIFFTSRGNDQPLTAAVDTLAVTLPTQPVSEDVAEQPIKRPEVSTPAKPEAAPSQPTPSQPAPAPVEAVPTNVTNMNFTSSVGTFKYTGPVDKNKKPHGNGTAQNEKVRYIGPFNHGVMHGSGAVFQKKTKSGVATFKGRFNNNWFAEGTYFWPDGSYFKGTFSNGQPNLGNYYDSEGNITSSTKNI